MLLPTDGELRLKKLELIGFALGAASWVVVVLDLFGVVSLAGLLPLGLYPLYACGAFVGSVAGNILATRLRRVVDPEERRRLLLGYVSAPPGTLVLLRSMAPVEMQDAAPLVPLLVTIIFAIFLIVPLTIRRPPERR